MGSVHSQRPLSSTSSRGLESADGSAAGSGPWGSNASSAAGGGGQLGGQGIRREREQVLNVQLAKVVAELRAAEADFAERESARAAAKAEWGRALAKSTAAQNRDERRLATAVREREELRAEENQQEATFKVGRDKMQQKLRNLRMQLRQAERQCTEVEQKEFEESLAGVSAEARCPVQTSPRGARSPRSAHERQVDLRRALEIAQDEMAELQHQRSEAVACHSDLKERERTLRREAHLSDSELANLHRRSELRDEEASARSEQAQLKAELRAVEREVQAAQREASHLRASQERALKEIGERDLQFQKLESSEKQALDQIDEFLTGQQALQPEQRAHLAEWLEADISTRQVEHVRARLSEIVTEAGERAQVLEQSVAELHLDLDRRAAIILELVERQERCFPGYSVPSSAQPSIHDPGGSADYESGSEDDDEGVASRPRQGAPGRSPAAFAQRGKNALAGPASDESGSELDTRSRASAKSPNPHEEHGSAAGLGLERQALEDELQHQRSLFELRSDQVRGLEQRLATLLEHEAPRVHALRAWIAVHEPLLRDQLEVVAEHAADEKAMRVDVEAMREERCLQLGQAAAEWQDERRRIAESGSEARGSSDEATARAAALQRHREQLLRAIDRLLKSERALAIRAASATEAVDKDQRRLVDSTARQIRAAAQTGAAKAGDRQLHAANRGQRGEAARQALADARALVEQTRARDVERLVCLSAEAATAETKAESADEAIVFAEQREGQARQELTLCEATTESGSAPGRPSTRSSPRAQSRGRAAPRSQKVIALDRRRVQREEDIERLVEQLQSAEQSFEDTEARAQVLDEAARHKVEEFQEAIETEKWKQKSASAGVLKRYRSAQADFLEGEQRCEHLGSQRDLIERELAELRSRHPKTRAAIGQRHSTPARADTHPFSEVERHPFVPGSRQASAASRAPPSISEVKQRVDGDSELYSFYLQVFPLLKGTLVDVFRRPKQRFEPRQLQLSSDLQRLELWLPTLPGAPGSVPRAKPRLAEAFVRIETVTRVHVPKTTLVAVQQTIMGAAGGDKGSGGYAFDLVLGGAEPWRLGTADVHTFHVATAAVGALLIARAALPSYAMQLGLGGAGLAAQGSH